jgi:hypothetical protein
MSAVRHNGSTCAARRQEVDDGRETPTVNGDDLGAAAHVRRRTLVDEFPPVPADGGARLAGAEPGSRRRCPWVSPR